MKKLLIICGPTATGKTALALNLAKIFNGEVISADSRQVYRELNIGTGKEFDSEIKIWGYDLVDPKKEFSVASYLKFARKALEAIWEKGKIPILVGGTGLYIKAVVDGIETISIPKNTSLRKSLSDKEAIELFEILAQMDPIKAASLNSSDSKNPRRLIRGIEIASHRLEIGRREVGEAENEIFSTLFIGLTSPKKFLDKKIEERVDRWIKEGIEKEIQNLIKEHISWSAQSMSSLGYRLWKDFFENPPATHDAKHLRAGKKTKEEVIRLWKAEEKEYAKRQMTWFKKDKRIYWFDISKPGYARKVEFMVKKWYSSGRNA